MEEMSMRGSGMRWGSVVAGIVLSLAGVVWALQGAGLIGGSAMSGQGQWLVIGVVVGAVGLGLLYRAFARNSPR
jgi:hypothetical protein